MATQEFVKLVSDFTVDLFRTFPEYEEKQKAGELHEGYLACIEYQATRQTQDVSADIPADIPESIESLYTELSTTLPKKFFDILYKNEDAVFDKDVVIFPSIDIHYLWSQDLSEHTRDILWNYLHLFLFSVLGNTDATTFGDTAKLFEAIDENTLKEKLQETVENMQSMFDSSFASFTDTSGAFTAQDIPNADELHKHVESMMNGKIGALAKEIAEETAQELDLNMDEVTDMNDVFKKLFQNPQKLFSMMQNIGKKLDTKMKEGGFKESELMEEAKTMMEQMKSMPGMKNFTKMMGKGMGGLGGMSGMPNFGAMQSQLQTNMKRAKQRERMAAKLEQKQTQFKTMEKFTVGEGASPYRTARSFKEDAEKALHTNHGANPTTKKSGKKAPRKKKRTKK